MVGEANPTDGERFVSGWSAGVDSQPADRLDEGSVDLDLEVQVGTAGVTGVAHLADVLTGTDDLTRLDTAGAVGHVPVGGRDALTADDRIDDDADAVAVVAL